MLDQILSHIEMCNLEKVQTLQRGMNFRLNPNYSILLMSRRDNAIYNDKILEDGITIEYEWHDIPKTNWIDVKVLNQPEFTKTWKLTQNGKFIKAVNDYKKWLSGPEIVKIYEKLLPWIRSLKWFFELMDYKSFFDWTRSVFKFILKLSSKQDKQYNNSIDLEHTRLIPSNIKKEVWKRDGGKCILCGSVKNLHFDHDLPFSKWWTSLLKENIKILCMQCNLRKSDKIE